MTLDGGSAEAWDPFTGAVNPYPFGAPRRQARPLLLPAAGREPAPVSQGRAGQTLRRPAGARLAGGRTRGRPRCPASRAERPDPRLLRPRPPRPDGEGPLLLRRPAEDLRGPRPRRAIPGTARSNTRPTSSTWTSSRPTRASRRSSGSARSRPTPGILPTSRPSSNGPPSSASSSTERKWSRWPGSGGSTGPSASSRSAPTSSPG
ncbi:MAG: hypothetical protein M0C28_38390 [Candidatus Moduliflexus flocculans]|nr:hypothetical protein [Candidatus Moduliflexus flocculans]